MQIRLVLVEQTMGTCLKFPQPDSKRRKVIHWANNIQLNAGELKVKMGHFIIIVLSGEVNDSQTS